jgi:hypothetical protein
MDKNKAEEKEALDLLHDPHPSPMLKDTDIRYTARCVRACVFRKRYWAPGEEYRGFVKPPEHFEIIEESGKAAGGKAKAAAEKEASFD